MKGSYGKIKSITRSGGSQKPNLEYEYSPDGHRVHKKVSYPSGDTINTYYIRDAQGNTMSTYTLKSDTFRWSEAHIYGSSRIGVYNAEKVLVIDTTQSVDTLQTNEYVHIRGKRHYELSNHLGNVLAVVSDRRTGVCTDDEIISYRAEIVSVTDYYAFGQASRMYAGPGRQGILNCHIDTTTTIDSLFVNIINENFASGTGNFDPISINDNSAVANVTGDELHVQAAWPDNATTYKQVTLVSGMSYTLTFDLVSSASIGSSTMECAILMPGDIQTHVITSGTNGFTFTSSYTGNVDIEFSYITDQDDAYSAFTPSFDIDDVVLREYPLREDFQSYSVGSFVANTAVSPSSTVTNSSGNELTIGATWPNRPTAFKSIYLENGTYTVNFDLNSLFTMGVVNTMECRVHLPGGSVVNQYTSTGNKVFTFVCSTTGWVDFEFAYLTNQNPMYTGWTPSIDIDNALVYRTIVNENFSSSSVGSFTNNVTGGMPTSSLSNPSGVLRFDIDAPFRPATDVLVPVTPGKKYSIDFDIVGFSSHSPATHSVRCRVEMAGYPTQHFVYTTTSSVPTIIVDVPSGFGGTDIRVEIASILSSSALSSNPYIHIDNFVVKEWVGITTTTYDTICSTWDKGYRYGFNSMEKDNEINVNGGDYDFGARIYDSRLGRWLSLDPLMKKYPGLNPYCGVGNNPIFYIDPDGQVIEPYARINMFVLFFLNVFWVDYPHFTSNTNGKAFHETRKSMLKSSQIFAKINNQLIHSKNNFRFTETSTTPSGVEATMSKKDTEAKGNFENNHSGKKNDPFIINFNLNTAQNISGHNSFSTIFEETFHAGQKDYYGINAPSKIDIEVEAKVSKALEGFDNGEFSQYFNGDFQKFRKDFKNGTTTPEQLNIFNKAVNDYAKDVSIVYIKYNISKGVTEENAEKNYGMGAFTGKFKYAEKLYGKKLNTEKAKE